MSGPRALRLVPVAAAAWASALVAVHVPSAAFAVAGMLWLVALSGLGVFAATAARRRVRGGPVLLVVVVAAALGAGAATHVSLAQPQRDAVLALGLESGRALTAGAVVTGKIEVRADGMRAFDAVLDGVAAGRRSVTADVPVTIRVHPADVTGWLDMGSEVSVRGSARAAPPGDRALLDITASRGVEVTDPPADVLGLTSALRSRLVGATAGLPEPGAGLIPGLAVGDTSTVGAELDADMKAASLSHLTAVSGANCALVVGIAFALAAFAGAGRGIRVIVAVATLAAFVLLVTPEPSVVRAAAMAAIAMLAVLTGRPGAGVSLVALAVAVLLVADPWLGSSLGFALSVVATASLLLFARPFADGLGRVMPRALALALSVPLAAQLACGPLLVIVSPTVPLYGVVANLLAAPAAPAATIVGLAACLAAPLPWLQSGLAAMAWVPAAWVAGTARTTAALPGGQLPWLEGWPGVFALAIVGLAIGSAIVPKRPTRWSGLLHTSAVITVAAVTGVGGGTVALSTVVATWTLPSGWSMLACDVGQGDAVLVRSEGRVALFDTGPEPAPLDACLDRAGITTVDLLVLTHYDLDHVGGVAALDDRRVVTVLHGPAAGSDDDAIVNRLVAGGADAVAASPGMTGSLGGAEWRVVWPPANSRAYPTGNDASVVLDVRGGGVPASLFLGDLSASPQRALVESGMLRPPYAVVKVAHHGSADQDPALYRIARPSIGLLTVGAGNDYGHPRAEILQLLEALGAAIARTDEQGVCAIAVEGETLVVWRERAPPSG